MAMVETWANGFGVWHVRVPRNAASPLIAARRALRDELQQRESHADPLVWMRPERVPDLDTEDTVVYREGTLREDHDDDSQPTWAEHIDWIMHRILEMQGNGVPYVQAEFAAEQRWDHVQKVRMPYSEVCMHMLVAGQLMLVEPVPHLMAQLYALDGTQFSFPITRGEAGLRYEAGPTGTES